MLTKWSLKFFMHDMTVGLPWHVHNLVAIGQIGMELQWNLFYFEFELGWKSF